MIRGRLDGRVEVYFGLRRRGFEPTSRILVNGNGGNDLVISSANSACRCGWAAGNDALIGSGASNVLGGEATTFCTGGAATSFAAGTG